MGYLGGYLQGLGGELQGQEQRREGVEDARRRNLAGLYHQGIESLGAKLKDMKSDDPAYAQTQEQIRQLSAQLIGLYPQEHHQSILGKLGQKLGLNKSRPMDEKIPGSGIDFGQVFTPAPTPNPYQKMRDELQVAFPYDPASGMTQEQWKTSIERMVQLKGGLIEKTRQEGLADPRRAAYDDLMTNGPNGGPRVNPATNQPYTSVEALQEVEKRAAPPSATTHTAEDLRHRIMQAMESPEAQTPEGKKKIGQLQGELKAIDPEGQQRIYISAQGEKLRETKHAEDLETLTPAAQKTILESTPTHEQIQELMAIFEPMKGDNTSGKFFTQRLEYSLGHHTPIGDAADAIAQLELNRVVGAARVMKGASRSVRMMERAMVHLPNVWIDSPQMIYSKLENLDKALTEIEADAYRYGKKAPMTEMPAPTAAGELRRKSQPGQGKKFSISRWKAKNPDGDEKAAEAAARKQGYEVVP